MAVFTGMGGGGKEIALGEYRVRRGWAERGALVWPGYPRCYAEEDRHAQVFYGVCIFRCICNQLSGHGGRQPAKAIVVGSTDSSVSESDGISIAAPTQCDSVDV